MLEGPREVRHQALARERKPYHRARDPVVVMHLADALNGLTEALVHALEERDLLFFGLGLLRHHVPNARIAARGPVRSSCSVSIPFSR